MAVCKGMLDQNRRCGGVPLNEDEYAVTTDGYTAFVFSKSEVIFDTEKVNTLPGLKNIFEDNEKDVELKRTKEYYEYSGRLAEKYVAESFEVYAYVDVAKPFNNCRLFANSATGRVLAKDDLGRIVGLYMPTKIYK